MGWLNNSRRLPLGLVLLDGCAVLRHSQRRRRPHPASPRAVRSLAARRAAFTFNALPFPIPYPVPFKLLGDERKGFIDVTYLSPDGKL